MKKGIIGLMTACMLFNLSVVGNTKKVEAAETYIKADSIQVGDTVLLVCESKKMELSSISTTSTKYGIGVAYTTAPAGKYPLTVVQGSSAGTYALQNSSGSYLYWTSGNSLNVNSSLTANTSWKITFSSGNATVLNGKDNTRKLQWNASSPRFACYTGAQTAIQIYKIDNSTPSCECTELVEAGDKHLATEATCTEKATYYKVCASCGKVSETETYEYGEPLGHNYEDGFCSVCGEHDPSSTPSDRVSSLFSDYYNEGSYTKDSVLNTSKIADVEVAKYFHASADIKYRKTIYTPEGLKMTTSEDGKTYGNDSIYQNEDGKVVHTGLGGDWSVNQPSVEDWFVTLKDFVDNSGSDWTYENGVYSHELVSATATSEDELTRMAREFVAPMWLAPNADNFAYAQFTKLTVEEAEDKLIMKLYVDNGDILVEGSNNVFSQVTISKESESLSTLAVFELGTNTSGPHKETTSSKTTYSETNNSYSLSITGGDKFYTDCNDELGNSCIKLGSSSAAGKFQFVVPEDVNEVIINLAGYKANTAGVTINDKTYTISTKSNSGEYTPITVDTSTNKTVTFATTSTGYRCMINSIEYHK